MLIALACDAINNGDNAMKKRRFSKRFDALDLASGEAALALSWRVLREQGAAVLDLTQSNPTLAGFQYPEEQLRAIFSRSTALPYHPAPRGMPEARQAIAAYYAARGWNIRAEDLILASGSSEAYAYLLKLLCDPGDAVMVPAPGYPLLDFAAMLENVRLVPCLSETAGGARPRITAASLESTAEDGVRAIVVIQPNNPTGAVLLPEEIAALTSFADAQGIAIIVDEVFCDYCRPGVRFTPVQSTRAPVFTINGVSKILGLPQVKCSWIHVGGPPDFVQAAGDHLELIADTYLSVNTGVQAALPELLALRHGIQGQIRARIARNERAAAALLAGCGAAEYAPPEGGWYLVLRFPMEPDDEVLALALLKEAGVYTHPGRMFGYRDGCRLVLSLITPESDFSEGLRRVLAFVA